MPALARRGFFSEPEINLPALSPRDHLPRPSFAGEGVGGGTKNLADRNLISALAAVAEAFDQPAQQGAFGFQHLDFETQV